MTVGRIRLLAGRYRMHSLLCCRVLSRLAKVLTFLSKSQSGKRYVSCTCILRFRCGMTGCPAFGCFFRNLMQPETRNKNGPWLGPWQRSKISRPASGLCKSSPGNIQLGSFFSNQRAIFFRQHFSRLFRRQRIQCLPRELRARGE